jgi:hypothetical protein
MDGWLTSSGVNPFLLPPSDPSLARFHQNEIYKLDVWRGTTTIYPPVALSIFSLEYWLYQELGMVGVKIMFIFPAVSLAVLFYKLFDRKVFVLFILNPLLLFETFSSGHLEVWAALFAFVSLKLYFSKHFNLSAGFLSLGILTKLFPILILPFLAFNLFKLKLEKLLTFLMIVFGISLVFYLPFLKTASYKPITRNIFIPLQHEFNSTFFRLIKSLMSNFISNPQISIHISSLVCVGLLSLIVVYLMRKKFSVGICIITMISFLLLSPIAYAWYTIFLMCLIFWFVDLMKKYWIIFFLIYMQVLISLTYVSEITSLTIYQVSSLMRVIAVVEVISLVAFVFLYIRSQNFVDY